MTNRLFLSFDIDRSRFEIVERKGVGHPDTLTDGLAEAISSGYSRYCKDNFGAILHHNFDKLAITGGLVETEFGSSRVIKPATVIINGRASESFGDSKISVTELTKKLAIGYLKPVLPHAESSYFNFLHLTNTYSHNPHWYKPRSIEDLPEDKKPYANDSSTYSSYWPLSLLENTVLKAEALLCDEPYYGQDIKILAVRNDNEVSFTICLPQIARLTDSSEQYTLRLKTTHQKVEQFLKESLGPYKVSLFINTADGRSGEGHYLLATGSCIEAGEEGVVGRGNKSRGIISSVRPSSMEAISGKNPVYHVGKIWAAVADSLSRAIAERYSCYCEVHVATKNGDDLFSPENITIITDKAIDNEGAEKIIEKHLSYKNWTSDIISKEIFIPRIGAGNDYTIGA